MRVTIVDEELPYPPVSGKRIRILNLALHLAKRHQITFLCHRNADADEARQAESYLQRHGIETILVDRQSRTPVESLPLPKMLTKVALNVMSSVPYSVQWNDCPALRAAVRRRATESDVDLWQCEWAPYATTLMQLADARWVMMAHDIQSLIWERLYRSMTNPLKRWYVKQQWIKYQRYEEQVFKQAPLTITVTEQDAQRAQKLFGALDTAVVDNGVDVPHYQSFNGQNTVKRRPNDILFLGNLEWRANLDAVRILLDEVFPKVVAEEPTARLHIVGRRPPQWLLRRGHKARNVEIHADVADVRPYLYQCGVMAVPLRIGGGSRLKILEALACGLPVISTAVGAEGLRIEPGRHFLQAETADEMSEVLLKCLRNPAPALLVAQAGQKVVEKQYDWAILAKKMEQAWNLLLRESATPAFAQEA